ncbi:unnamed protein product [Durusdinium trenchii]|uniref:Uncharacterized protein n=2 Tax=Durusdinium trenchii TaxID=1381693 RepID=A0ABP0MD16_9DINO
MGCCASAQHTAQHGILESEVFFQKYALGKKIGEGAFGQVRLTTDLQTKQSFAVKIADVRARQDGGKVVVNPKRKAAIEREIEMWQLASSSGLPEITQLIECFYSLGFYYLVCEACEKNLMQHLLHVKTISEDELGEVAAQMLRSIAHVHFLGMVHRDVKPENFLYGGPNGSTLKLCDFGLALRQPKKGKKLTGIGGTAPYMAPEILISSSGWPSNEGYDKEIDMWAMGVILYLVLYGQFPYMPKGEATADSMKTAIRSNSPPLAFPPIQALAALGLVKKLLVRLPADRATAEEARLDPFISKASGAFGPTEVTVALSQAKEMAERLKEFQVSASSQRDLEAKLKAMTAARGGIWFSESEAVSPTQSQCSATYRAEARIKKDKKPVSRDKFGTHSGVVSEETKDVYPEAPLQ